MKSIHSGLSPKRLKQSFLSSEEVWYFLYPYLTLAFYFSGTGTGFESHSFFCFHPAWWQWASSPFLWQLSLLSCWWCLGKAPRFPCLLSLSEPFSLLGSVPVSVKFGLLYWQQNILYFLTEKYLNQTCLISTINCKPNYFLQLHYRIHFSEPAPAFSTNQKGLFHFVIFCESQDTSEEHDYMSPLSVEMISYFYYSKL